MTSIGALPDDLQAKISINNSAEEFINSLVEQCMKRGKLPDGKYALIGILDGVREKVGKDERYEINELKVQVIKAYDEPGQAYVSLILDCDYDTYLPLQSGDLIDFSDLQQKIQEKSYTFTDLRIKINEINKKRRSKKVNYPYFNVEPWIPYDCSVLEKNWSKLTDHFWDDRFLAVLVDTSVFDDTKPETEQCHTTLGNVLTQISGHHTTVGVALIKNRHVKSYTIPPGLDVFFESWPDSVEAIAYFLWMKYDAWEKTRRVGKSVTIGVEK
jgi:hypothetical protein